jgi:hypothetical protein
MSADYDEQPGGAEPALDTFVPPRRRGPAGGGGSERGQAQDGPQRIAEVRA